MLQDHIDQLLNVFSDGVCVTDAQGNVLYLNDMHEKLTGVKHDTMIGHNVLEFVGQDVFDVVINPEVIRTGKPVTKVQTLANGSRLVLEGHPIFDEGGRGLLCGAFARRDPPCRTPGQAHLPA